VERWHCNAYSTCAWWYAQLRNKDNLHVIGVMGTIYIIHAELSLSQRDRCASKRLEVDIRRLKIFTFTSSGLNRQLVVGLIGLWPKTKI